MSDFENYQQETTKKLASLENEISNLQTKISEASKQIKSAANREDLYIKVFQSTTHPLLILNPLTRTFIWANIAATDLYNMSLERILRNTLDELDMELFQLVSPQLKILEVGKVISLPIKSLTSFNLDEDTRSEIKVSALLINEKKLVLIEIFRTNAWPAITLLINEKIAKVVSIWKAKTSEEIARKEAFEKKLKKLEIHYKLLLHSDKLMFYSQKISASGLLLIESIEGCSIKKVTGFDAQEINEDGGWSSIILPSDLSAYLQSKKLLFENKTSEAEYRILTKSGKVLWIKEIMSPIFEGNSAESKLVRVVGIFEDISNAKNYVESVKEFEKQAKIDAQREATKLHEKTPERKTDDDRTLLKIILNTYPIQIYHDNCVILEVSEEFFKELGYRKEDVMKRTIYDFLDTEYKADFFSLMAHKDGRNARLAFKTKAKSLKPFDAVNFNVEYKGRVVSLLALRVFNDTNLLAFDN